jgi:hypothetical protein
METRRFGTIDALQADVMKMFRSMCPTLARSVSTGTTAITVGIMAIIMETTNGA